MIRRRRPLLRAAAVGGTAYAVGRRSGRQREEQANAEADQDQRIADLEQQQQAPPPPPPPAPAPAPAAQPSMLDQLNQLTDLHTQGALSDEEFTAAKAKLLG
jgi:putative oligomerization/nucleic acid binding protein